MDKIIAELKDCLALAEDFKDDPAGLVLMLEDKEGPIYAALYSVTSEELEEPGA